MTIQRLKDQILRRYKERKGLNMFEYVLLWIFIQIQKYTLAVLVICPVKSYQHGFGGFVRIFEASNQR